MSPINPAQLQKKLEQKAMEQKKRRQEAAANILTIHTFLEESKKIGLDVKPFEDGLKEVQRLMRERLFMEAAEKSSEVIKKMKEEIKKIAGEKLAILETMASKEEKMGVEGGKIGQVLEKVKVHMENKDFFIAIKEAEEGIKEAENLEKSYAQSLIEEGERLIGALKDVANTSEAENILNEAREKLDKGDTEEVVSLSERLKETLKDASESAKERLLTEAELDITILERMGENVKPYEERLGKAKKSGDSGAISEILEVGRLVREAVRVSLSAGIEELASEAEEIKDMGGEPGEILESVEKAKENLEKNNLALAAETVGKGKKAVEETKFNIVVRAMNPAFSKMKAANKIGVDISEAEKILVDARNALKLGEYRKAMELSKRCENTLDEIIESYKKTTGMLSELEKLFSEAEKSGSDTSEAKKLLVAVKNAVSKRDFRNAYTLAIKTRDSLQKGRLEGIKEKIKRGKQLVELGESEGIEVVEEDVTIQEAEKALEKENLEKAEKMAEDALEELKKKVAAHLSSAYKQMKETLTNMREYIDVSDEMKTLIKGKKSIEFGDYSSAFSTLEELEKRAKELGKAMADKSIEKAKKDAEEVIASEDIEAGELEDALADMLLFYNEGKYGEAFEASKDIEQMAQKLAREWAQKRYNDAKNELIRIKNMKEKIDIREFHERLIEAKAEFKRGNYLECSRIAGELIGKMEEKVSFYKNAKAAVSVAQSAVKKAKGRGIDIRKYEKNLLKAKEGLKNGNYKEAIKISESISDALEGISGKGDLDARLRMMEAKIFSAKTIGITIKNSEEKIEEIKRAIEGNKLEEGSKIADALEEEIETVFKDMIGRKISVADSLVLDAKDIGINVEKAEENILIAKDALAKGDYIDAYRYAEDAQKIIDEIKSVSKKVAGKIKEAQNRIREAESIRADVRNANIALDRAIEALKSNRTKEAMNLAEECLELVEKSEEEKVRRVIKDFMRMIEKSKKTGMDTSLAENLVHQSESAVENKEYKKALSLVMQSESELEKVELQKDIAEKAINTLRKNIEEAKKDGISVEKVVAIVNRAEGAADAGAYIKSFEYTMNGNEKLRELMDARDRVVEKMNSLENKLAEAREDQIEAPEASELAVKAKSLLSSGNVVEAKKLMDSALKSLDKALLEHVDDIIDYAEAKIKYARKMGENVSEAESALKEAKKIKDSDPSKALSLANGARGMIDSLGVDTSFVDRAYGINFEIMKAKKYGVNAGSAEKMLKEAIEMVEKDIEKANEMLSKTGEEIKRITGQLTPKLEFEIKADTLEKGKWKGAILSITNKGSAPVKDVHMEVMGDIEVEGMKDIGELGKGSTAEFPVKIMAIREGEIKVKGILTGKRTFDGKEFKFSSEESLKTREKVKPAAQPKETVAEKPEKCAFCNGKIKPGMKMVMCGKCGATYHVPCAKRAGKCKVCGASLVSEEKPKVVRKKLALKLG